MKNFLEHTYQIVRKALERYLYQVQEKENNKQEEQKVNETNRRKHFDELNGGSKLRSILRDSKTNSKKLPMITGLYKTRRSDDVRMIFIIELPTVPYPMTSEYSDIVSNSVVALLKRDPRRVIFITEKLFGQQIPLSLRQFIWTECLLRVEKKPHDYDLVQRFSPLKRRRLFFIYSLESC